MTHWAETKAKRAERDPELYGRVAREREKLALEQLDHAIAEKRKDRAFIACIRAAIKRDKSILDGLRDR